MKRNPDIFKLVGLVILLAITLQACRYKSPLIGIDGFETHLVTDPGYLRSPLKWIQTFGEIRLCTYVLLGWHDEDLYFNSTCSSVTVTQKFSMRTKSSSLVRNVPNLSSQLIEDEKILDIVRAEGVSPEEVEPYTRHIYLGNGIALGSENRAYTAFITERPFAVQDVVILEGKID